MKDMNCDEHGTKNNLNILFAGTDEKKCSENMRIIHTVHPLTQSNNPRAIDDEEWESMLRHS